MTRSAKVSYAIVALVLVLAAWLGLVLPMVAALFSYFALRQLSFFGSKTIGLVLFTFLVIVAGYGSFYFLNQALNTFPRIAENAIPAIIRFARERGLELPFGDWDSFKSVALETVMEEIRFLGKRATILGKEAVLIVVGFVIAASLFLGGKWEPDGRRDNLYALACGELVERFAALYRSFAMVMGAQLIISAINTALTAVFVIWTQLPYAGLLVVVTFFCGVLPIIGNLVSNTVIVSVAFTITPKLGVAAFVFLIVLHKLEYFLNSQIIGSRIKNPMWLTLIALVIAERLMGISGMILAPVLLHYIKLEASKIRVETPESEKRDA